MGLQDIVNNNHYPIIFIGSGISKRYLKNSPTWASLLKEYWDRLDESQNYYSFLRRLDDEFIKKGGSKASKDLITFYSSTKVASYIEQKFNDLFFEEKIKVPGLSLQKAQEEMISPFKYDITNRFRKIELRDDIDSKEFELFKQVILKARIIVTTNYDEFIENILQKDYHQDPTIYVGNQGFFTETNGWSEIYKIHGSVSDSKSIVITARDYEQYDENSILISAKILSSMIESPVIFLGYSLQDRNVRTLLNDFSKQLPSEDPRKSANRILAVNYVENNMDVVERIVSIEDSDITCTTIDTDNYTAIFREILKIDEGASPYEVKKYERLIRKLIISAGEKGTLKKVMISPDDIDNLGEKIDKNESIVMALGESKYFYVYPDLLSYVNDYFTNTNNYAVEVALSFVAKAHGYKSRIPFSKYWQNVDRESTSLTASIIESLEKKIQYCGNFKDIRSSVNQSYQIEFDSIDQIKEASGASKIKLYDMLAFNIENLSEEELEEFLFDIALPEFKQVVIKNDPGNLKPLIRKFLLAYDFRVNGELNPQP